MTKFVAKVGIIVGFGVCALGNYWFTFGIWPRSWWSFTLFLLASIVLMGMNEAIDKES